MQLPPLFIFAPLLLASLVRLEAADSPKPTSHTIRQVEGWTVRVDDRLLARIFHS
jgi:hypothetical protein